MRHFPEICPSIEITPLRRNPLRIIQVRLIPLVIFRFEWLLRFWIFRAMFRWGKPYAGFPTSRTGVVAACVFGLVLGAMAVDHNFKVVDYRIWAGLFFTALVTLPIFAFRDYLIYKRTKQPDDLRQRVDAYIEERSRMRSEKLQQRRCKSSGSPSRSGR